MKKVFASIFILFILLLACNRKTESGGADSAQKKMRFFLITMDSIDEHWLALRDGAQAKLEELSPDGELVFLAPPLKTDPSEQIRMVEDAIIQQASGIILAATNSTALVPVVKRIKEKGIPLVLVDSPVEVDDSYYITFASTDNYQAAALAADTMAELIDNKGKIAIILGQAGAGTTILRENGFVERIQQQYPDIEIVATQYSDGEKLVALNQTTDIMQGNPDIAGFYGGNEGSTVGVSRAVESSNTQNNKIAIVGFDKSSDIIAGIDNGVIDASMVQNPEKMGSIAIESILKYIQDPSADIPKSVDTGVLVVTKENLDLIKK